MPAGLLTLHVRYWCAPGKREESDARCLNLSTLTDCFAGKQTPSFNQGAAAAAPAERCFSLVGKTAALHIEEESKESVANWMTALQFILTTSGQKVVVDGDEKAAAAVGLSTGAEVKQGQAAGGPRRMSIMVRVGLTAILTSVAAPHCGYNSARGGSHGCCANADNRSSYHAIR